MKLDNQVVFVSGTNRGIGKAIVDALLKRKVKKVYAAARKIDQLAWKDARVVPCGVGHYLKPADSRSSRWGPGCPCPY